MADALLGGWRLPPVAGPALMLGSAYLPYAGYWALNGGIGLTYPMLGATCYPFSSPYLGAHSPYTTPEDLVEGCGSTDDDIGPSHCNEARARLAPLCSSLEPISRIEPKQGCPSSFASSSSTTAVDVDSASPAFRQQRHQTDTSGTCPLVGCPTSEAGAATTGSATPLPGAFSLVPSLRMDGPAPARPFHAAAWAAQGPAAAVNACPGAVCAQMHAHMLAPQQARASRSSSDCTHVSPQHIAEDAAAAPTAATSGRKKFKLLCGRVAWVDARRYDAIVRRRRQREKLVLPGPAAPPLKLCAAPRRRNDSVPRGVGVGGRLERQEAAPWEVAAGCAGSGRAAGGAPFPSVPHPVMLLPPTGEALAALQAELEAVLAEESGGLAMCSSDTSFGGASAGDMAGAE